jgi:hypothetical protein
MIDDDRPGLLPTSCRLDLADGRKREQQWHQLARYQLGTTRTADSIVLRFQDLIEVHDQLRTLAALERDCCPFLTFEVARADGALVLTISATPGSAPEVALELDRLAPWLVPSHR